MNFLGLAGLHTMRVNPHCGVKKRKFQVFYFMMAYASPGGQLSRQAERWRIDGLVVESIALANARLDE